MKEILTDHYSAAQSALYEYLKKNIDSFNDKTLFKSIQHNCINADDNSTPSNVFIRQSENLIEKLLKSDEKLSELACLLVFLNNEDYEQVAYTMHDKIDYSTIDDPELLEKLELIRRFIRLLYLHIDDSVIPTLDSLMQILPENVDASKILWEFYHFNNDTDDRDYELLIDMSYTILKYRKELNSLYFLAQLYLEMEEYQKATDIYYSCINLSEQNPDLNENTAWLYYHLANCSFIQEKYEEAIEFTSTSLEKYLELNTNGTLDKAYYPLVMGIRARLYADLNNIEQALKDVETGLVYDPDNQDLLNLKEELENN